MKRDISVNNFCHYRCKCSHCSIEAVTKAEECICCKEIDRVGEVMSQVDLEDQCITLHPGFHDVCLNRWVLQIASLALKTKAGKSYRTLFSQGLKSESEWVVRCYNVVTWYPLFIAECIFFCSITLHGSLVQVKMPLFSIYILLLPVFYQLTFFSLVPWAITLSPKAFLIKLHISFNKI